MKMLYEVLDHGFVRIVDKMGTDESIVQAARVSYGAGTKHVQQDRSLIRYLLRHKHTSPFEMCVIKLHLKMPIFIARQWIRHRTASVNEYSARYSIMKDEFYIPENIYSQSKDNKQGRSEEKSLNSEEISAQIKTHSENSYKLYEDLIEKGVARETARIVLPTNIYTEFYWQINLHNLLHFIRLRKHSTAQYEIRMYAMILEEVLKEWMPITYEAFEDYVINSVTFSDLTKKSLNMKDMKEEEKQALGKTELKEFEEIFQEINKK